ncbi:Fic family protein [Simkania sp.]|uniref:Fic family protein n=1 Tax=Simkania sp. TaxID=34094 RepID=UPI003B516DEA
MDVQLFLNKSQTVFQDIRENPERSGKLLTGATFFTIVAMTAFQINPLTYPITTVVTIGALFFSLQFSSIRPQKAFTYTLFPTWYKEKNIFDCALLTNIWLNYNGKNVTAALAVTADTKDVSQRHEHAFEVLRSVKQQGIIGQIFDQQQGRGLAVGDGKNLYSLGIDWEFVRNRQAALTFVEQNLLCTPTKINTAEQMEQFICSLHALLAKDLVNSSGIPIPPGVYRDSIILLPRDNVGHKPDAIAENVKRKESTAVKLFRKLVKRVNESEDPSETLRKFTKEEARLFNLGYDTLYMDPKEISAAMKKFCSNYVNKIQDQTNPLDLATWVHMELIKIHPFIDLNGHISRTLASAELRRGELSPIFIFDENAYVKAQEKRDPEEFKAFLKRTIALTAKLEQILDNESPSQTRQITLHD